MWTECFELGEGVKQNLNQAFYFYNLVASQKESYSQYKLGLFYELGLIGKKDPNQARYFYKLSTFTEAKVRYDALNHTFLKEQKINCSLLNWVT